MNTDEDKARLILLATATLFKNQSSEMAWCLLTALYILHHETKHEGATSEDLISLLLDGVRELDSKLMKLN